MKRLSFLLFVLMIAVSAYSQKKPKAPVMPDMQKLMKMTPEEQKKYAEEMQKQLGQQAKEMADEYGMKIDPSALPGGEVTPPVKDIRRLSLIPATPPTRQQLLTQVSKMEAALKTQAGPQLTQQIEQFSSGKNGRELQRASVGGFYGDQPQAALLLAMKATQKQPDNPANWNNLGAMLNMNKMEEYAIPMLQRTLAENPQSATVLNNIGQGYLGLGDLNRSEQYFKQCLDIDPMHPEANRSMAMIKTFNGQFDEALQHFEKEFQIAQRKSSMAQLKRKIRNHTLTLTELRRRKMAMDGIPQKDFFSEIALGKFSIPDLPTNTDEVVGWSEKYKGFMQSLTQEFMFWSNAGVPTQKQLEEEGKKYPGVYFDLVNDLLSDLGKEYSGLLGLIEEDDVPFLQAMVEAWAKADHETICPSPPADPNNGAAVAMAYQKKCCDMRKPHADKLVAEYNAFLTHRIRIVQSRWKEYINGMINIVQLDPSMANKRVVYATVSQYFGFLLGCMQAVNLTNPPMECHIKLTTQQADSILQSTRKVELECPSWLKINFSVSVAKVKADCDGFNVEADVYKLIKVGAEKSFKTGSSTLYVGAGVDGKFYKDILSTEVSQTFYIVFDNNNQFSDLGMRGTGSFDIANGMFGEEFTYDFSMSSGFSSNLEAKSGWVEKFEKAVGYIPK